MNQYRFHSSVRSGTIFLLASVCILFQATGPGPVRAEQLGSQNRSAANSLVDGCPLFPPNNIWNTAIDNLPVHPRSDEWVNNIGRSTHFHMDFGTVWDGGPNGIPYNVVGSDVPEVPVAFDYDDESDAGPYPIPGDPLIEYGDDHHLLIVEASTCTLYELYDVRETASGWRAGSGAIWNLYSNDLRPAGWTSADAAGLPILPGLVRYEEVMSGEIDHAIRFTVQSTNRYLWPARHLTTNNPSAPQIPPMGAHFRLKASYDISSYPVSLQVILRAMKKYGIILADNGSNWYVSGAPNPNWDDDVLRQLNRLTGNDFEAVETSGLMIDANSGAAARSMIVTTTSDGGAGSLRQAITDAALGDRIRFDPSLAGQTITLTSDLSIGKSLTIDGSGLAPQVTISGGNARHILIPLANVVTISDLTISNGYAAGNGGAIRAAGKLTLIRSTLKDNTSASSGGAIYSEGSLIVSNSTFTNNTAAANGGAIYGQFVLDVNKSTFVGNSASSGGAIYVDGGIFVNPDLSRTIVNNTFVANQADAAHGSGGAVFTNGSATEIGSPLVLSNNTFSQNGASAGGGLYSLGSISFRNNIFANSTRGGDCVTTSLGSMVYGVNNLIADGIACSMGPFLSGDPLLGGLANHGGFTQTLALDPDSPAIDAGTDLNCPATDQRAMTRPQGMACDIGAYEAPMTSAWYLAGMSSAVIFGKSGDQPVVADYTGDGRDDVAIFRPSNGAWYIHGLGNSFVWGTIGDIPVVADYNGDGAPDVAVFRPSNSTWYINGRGAAFIWGTVGDIPVPADYNGDGLAEVAVFRPSNSTWYIAGLPYSFVWGTVGDIPVVADYNGDGRAEVAVFRPSNSTWYIVGRGAAFVWGTLNDIPVVADYNGDGRADVAVFRPANGTWYISILSYPFVWGAAGDIPVPADYNGDGRAEVGVFRP